MRKAYFLIMISSLPLALLAQNKKDFHHIIKRTSVDSDHVPLRYFVDGKSKPIRICSPMLEGIISMVGGVPTVDFFQITDTLYSTDTTCISKNTKLGAFILNLSRPTLGDPTRIVRVPFRAKSWSVATVPFRYRFNTDSSSSTVTTNLSVSFSYGWTTGFSRITHRGINNYSVTLGPFLGFSSADLKKATVKKPSSWAGDRTNIALSFGGSATLARNNFGLVISIGFDHAFGQHSSQWSYQDKPWIGLGINTSLGIF